MKGLRRNFLMTQNDFSPFPRIREIHHPLAAYLLWMENPGRSIRMTP
jgi:hypothetical protein